MTPYYADDLVTLHHGDCLDVLRTLPTASVDAVVTDPPYGLEFMGKEWDRFTDSAARIRQPSARDNAPGSAHNDSTFLARRNMPDAYRAGHPFQEWCQEWATEALRVLKPGGYMLAFGGTRTWHRLACAVEDAGFEMRDSIAWLYGSGFPKSLDVSKAIDKAARGVPQGSADPTSPNHGKYRTTTTEGKRWDGDAGQGYGAGGSRFLADGQASGSATGPAVSGAAAAVPEAERWQGWGTALKPAFEPVVVARKPLAGTVAANVLTHGTGALNVDACRIGTTDDLNGGAYSGSKRQRDEYTSTDTEPGAVALSRLNRGIGEYTAPTGRWPANVVLDETQAAELDRQSGHSVSNDQPRNNAARPVQVAKGAESARIGLSVHADSGGASRFFYVAKAPQHERPRDGEVAHPTVKPLDLMRWLVRLVTPPGGIVLEPFAGSGTTAEACVIEGFRCIAIEREATYLPLILARLSKPIQPDLFGGAA